MVNVAINGFGRIGRLIFRILLKSSNVKIVAINDLVPADNLAYLLKYDSTHGVLQEKIEAFSDKIVVNGKETLVFSERDPSKLPWKNLNIDYVIEATGLFTSRSSCEKHLEAGAKHVLVTAPGSGEMATFVMGVNHEKYDPLKDKIVSNASCTTNCLAPIAKVLVDHFGIEEGLMTTIHSLTATQPTVDGPSKKDWRGGRGALQNIIPSKTGAATAVGLCLPELKGKLTGMAFRIPTADVSVVDLTVRLSTKTTYEKICDAIKQAAQGSMKGFLAYSDELLVSSDFIGSTYSSIFDKQAGIALNDTFYKIVAWYDNEMGYASRCVDLLVYMASKDNLHQK